MIAMRRKEGEGPVTRADLEWAEQILRRKELFGIVGERSGARRTARTLRRGEASPEGDSVEVVEASDVDNDATEVSESAKARARPPRPSRVRKPTPNDSSDDDAVVGASKRGRRGQPATSHVLAQARDDLEDSDVEPDAVSDDYQPPMRRGRALSTRPAVRQARARATKEHSSDADDARQQRKARFTRRMKAGPPESTDEDEAGQERRAIEDAEPTTRTTRSGRARRQRAGALDPDFVYGDFRTPPPPAVRPSQRTPPSSRRVNKFVQEKRVFDNEDDEASDSGDDFIVPDDDLQDADDDECSDGSGDEGADDDSDGEKEAEGEDASGLQNGEEKAGELQDGDAAEALATAPGERSGRTKSAAPKLQRVSVIYIPPGLHKRGNDADSRAAPRSNNEPDTPTGTPPAAAAAAPSQQTLAAALMKSRAAGKAAGKSKGGDEDADGSALLDDIDEDPEQPGGPLTATQRLARIDSDDDSDAIGSPDPSAERVSAAVDEGRPAAANAAKTLTEKQPALDAQALHASPAPDATNDKLPSSDRQAIEDGGDADVCAEVVLPPPGDAAENDRGRVPGAAQGGGGEDEDDDEEFLSHARRWKRRERSPSPPGSSDAGGDEAAPSQATPSKRRRLVRRNEAGEGRRLRSQSTALQGTYAAATEAQPRTQAAQAPFSSKSYEELHAKGYRFIGHPFLQAKLSGNCAKCVRPMQQGEWITTDDSHHRQPQDSYKNYKWSHIQCVSGSAFWKREGTPNGDDSDEDLLAEPFAAAVPATDEPTAEDLAFINDDSQPASDDGGEDALDDDEDYAPSSPRASADRNAARALPARGRAEGGGEASAQGDDDDDDDSDVDDSELFSTRQMGEIFGDRVDEDAIERWYRGVDLQLIHNTRMWRNDQTTEQLFRLYCTYVMATISDERFDRRLRAGRSADDFSELFQYDAAVRKIEEQVNSWKVGIITLPWISCKPGLLNDLLHMPFLIVRRVRGADIAALAESEREKFGESHTDMQSLKEDWELRYDDPVDEQHVTRTCSICTKPEPWTQIVASLHGPPAPAEWRSLKGNEGILQLYEKAKQDPLTLREFPWYDEDDDDCSRKWIVGRTCAKRLLAFHFAHHFKFRICLVLRSSLRETHLESPALPVMKLVEHLAKPLDDDEGVVDTLLHGFKALKQLCARAAQNIDSLRVSDFDSVGNELGDDKSLAGFDPTWKLPLDFAIGDHR